jgi:hypothetical protein
MRPVGIVICLVIALFLGCLFLCPKVALHAAKSRALKEHGTNPAVMDKVPQAPPIKVQPSINYSNVVWMPVSTGVIGFPADQFTLDPDSARAKVLLHNPRYRMMVFSDTNSSITVFRPVMETLDETNFYQFVLDSFNATAHDIARQPNRDALKRHLLLLEVKAMFSTPGYDDSCLEFDRGDIRGFIIGDPLRDKIVYVRAFIQNDEEIVTFGLIQEKHIQMSDIEELISKIKVR